MKHDWITRSSTRFSRDLRLVALCLMILLAIMILKQENDRLNHAYTSLISPLITDRTDAPIWIMPNARGSYSRGGALPDQLKTLVLAKEDQLFFWHPGINPWSLARESYHLVMDGKRGGTSTITQQLAKILLNQENDRTRRNRIRELGATLTLELFHTKQDILEQYLRVAYLGEGAQGFPEASEEYYHMPLIDLDTPSLLSLVATLSSPSTDNPRSDGHKARTVHLASRLGIPLTMDQAKDPSLAHALHQGDAVFEVQSLGAQCTSQYCQTTLDQDLTKRIRERARALTDRYASDGATHSAVVVIKMPEREILSLVGSPSPKSGNSGMKIDMTRAPRPTGSTLKPLIYAKGFEAGLRPYSRVLDEEYRYSIDTGFSLYPKNYDGLYHGETTLEIALNNSYNVPAVKVLEYIGVDTFTRFLNHDLRFTSLQDINSYQFGIALGGMEMDPMTLAQYCVPFADQGNIGPLVFWKSGNGTGTPHLPPMNTITDSSTVLEPSIVSLVNTVLIDRALGVEQFGQTGNLIIPGREIAVKTGTSRDYHDSWAIGWTPDFIVVAWVGNVENTPLKGISGSAGAGHLWRDTIELLQDSVYDHHTPFPQNGITDFPIGNTLERGLTGDDRSRARALLRDTSLIVRPHDGDTFLMSKQMQIPLRAREPVTWFINGEVLTRDQKETTFTPKSTGSFLIRAVYGTEESEMTIRVEENDTPENN